MILQKESSETLDEFGWPRWPIHGEPEHAFVSEVIHSGRWWKNEGSMTARFEQRFASYQNCEHSLAVNNGTQALEIALKSVGVRKRDEVIVPAISFYSTASAVLSIGAVPVFCDVLPDTFCIDAASAESLITDRTKAIVPVHFGGQMSDMRRIAQLKDRYGLAIVEDAAHAPGSEWDHRRAGELSDAAAFSFQAAKVLTSGEGGAICTNSAGVAEEALLYSNCGRMPGDTEYLHCRIGTNSRLSEFNSAILFSQLDRFDDQLELRERALSLIMDQASSFLGIGAQLQHVDNHITRNSCYSIMIKLKDVHQKRSSRDDVIEALQREGVSAQRCYPTIYSLPIFRGERIKEEFPNSETKLPDYTQIRLPVAEAVSESTIAIPHRFLLGGPGHTNRLIEVIKHALKTTLFA